MEEGVLVRPVSGCLNGRLCVLWCLSQMSLEGKMSSAGRRSFGMMMREKFFMELVFLDGTCLGKVTCSKKDVVLFEEVVWMVCSWWLLL